MKKGQITSQDDAIRHTSKLKLGETIRPYFSYIDKEKQPKEQTKMMFYGILVTLNWDATIRYNSSCVDK